ncbi:MarR family winged helix-turn-helix transcriptional regulator [Streptacidiphilus griseoplanus]|uniref:MarR family winged helix-turn-helix transcriptional regulator n=1 Tax=Peterkaempfera griseoplana TaxID=66896 RepID=UPI0007C6B25D|nr:MarR family transcriptional regulator [Peterkaempfera griseoplana]
MNPETDRAAVDLRLSVMRLARRLRAEREPGGLTLGRLSVLGYLERDGPATASALANAERITPQSMARIVQHLIGDGLVERGQDPADRRASLLRITDAGRELVLQDRRKREAWLSEALATRLTDVERELLLLAARLLDRLASS